MKKGRLIASWGVTFLLIKWRGDLLPKQHTIANIIGMKKENHNTYTITKYNEHQTNYPKHTAIIFELIVSSSSSCAEIVILYWCNMIITIHINL